MSKCKIVSWVKNLFENKKPRKPYRILSKKLVNIVKEDIDAGYSRDTIMRYWSISQSTYCKIKNGTNVKLRGEL